MISSELLKQIIVTNERYIAQEVGAIIPREIDRLPATVHKVCLLYGVRRSGKSYVLYDWFKKNPSQSLYIDFEDERLEGFGLEDFERLKECFFELKPHLIHSDKLSFFLDEVQNIKGWEKFSRRVVEREGIHVFATGSSSKMMPQEIHTALRGRSWSQHMFPFSFREYAESKGLSSSNSQFLYGNKRPLLKRSFDDYLKWGGFPEICFLKSDFERTKVLTEYLDAMFFKDLVERFRVTNIPLLDHLKDKLFSSFSLKYSLTSFCKQYKDKFRFSKDSVFSYYRHFLDSMLIWEVRKLSESSYQRLRNPSKIYLVDNGLATRVTSADKGRFLENTVFLELKRRDHEVFYFEQDRECDFVTKSGNHWAAYQVTWEVGDSNYEREVEGLIEACHFLHLKHGLILTYDQDREEKKDGVVIRTAPVWKWLCQPEAGVTI